MSLLYLLPMPHRQPSKTEGELEALIVCTRLSHPTWGGKTIRAALESAGVEGLPSDKTCCNIIKRNGLVDPAESAKHTAYQRFEKEHCNEMWQTDFKGDFLLGNGVRCYPLTILDDHSRFSLCLDAKENEQWAPTKSSLVRIFREFGLPNAILCDNGSPWADNQGGYTPFEIWMMQMDILPMHGRPLHPQTQGKDERFHRTLKEDLLKRKPLADLNEAQREFDAFRYCYNYERPHAALKLDVPAKHYKPSKRGYIEEPKEPEYDSGKNLRKVNCKGYISVQEHRYYLSESMIGKYIELRQSTDNLMILAYGNFEVARINLETKQFDSRKIYKL